MTPMWGRNLPRLGKVSGRHAPLPYAGSKLFSSTSARSLGRPVPWVSVSRSGGLNVRQVTMQSALRRDNVAPPRWPTLLGVRPQYLYRAGASEWERLLTTC